VGEIVRNAAARSKREREVVLLALWNLVSRNRRRYGGTFVHVGLLLIALGVTGTRAYQVSYEVVLSPGETATAGRYTLLLEDLRDSPADDHIATRATIAVYGDDVYLATLRPRVDRYFTSDQTVTVPAVRSGLREDVYLVLAGWTPDRSTATVKVSVNPLASFLWLGGLVLLGGGLVAASAGPSVTQDRVARGKWRTARTAIGATAVAVLVGAALLAVWGPEYGAAGRGAGRPLPGQAAPSVRTTALDGSEVVLSDLRGEVVVLNFWASWCPPCEDELPALRAVWEEYRGRGVVLVGIAMRDNEADVREAVSRLDITFPVALDAGSGVSNAYGVTGPPETFVIDRTGRVARVFIGPVTAAELREQLDRLLEVE
jgi:cytochrome c-type biogenesis protein CcmF